MPIYEYKCTHCDFGYEKLESVDAPKDRGPCPITSFMCFCDGKTPCKENRCPGRVVRIPSAPGPPKFNCSMPTYQKSKGP